MLEIDTVMGRMFAPDWQSDLIVRALLDLGEWARIEQLIASSLVRDGDAIWDGGAFLGTFGIGVSQIASAAGRKPSRLLAIDPGRELRPFLQANLKTLAPCQAELVSCAVAFEQTSMVIMSMAGAEDNHGAMQYVQAGPDVDGGFAGRPLWHLRNEFGDYDFLKLDLEGSEFDAIRSDFEYLKSRKPIIWAECNESHQSVKVLEALVALGYVTEYLAFPSFRKVSYKLGAEPPYPMAYEAVLLGTTANRRVVVSDSEVAEQVIHRSVMTSWDLRQALWATPRWSMKDWLSMPRHELIGVLGKLSLGLNLQDYLAD